MNYQIDFKPRALKDLKRLPETERRRVVSKIEGLQSDLAGDVKKLTNFTPEYRLRVGDYRVRAAPVHRDPPGGGLVNFSCLF